MIRTVKISDETYHTMDSYDSDLPLDDHEAEDGWDEDDVGEAPLGSVPKELWSDFSVDQCPPEPEPWVDRLADMVELGRLCGMQVVEEISPEQLSGEDRLTTKFVYDWRLKDYTLEDGSSTKRWLRRSRLVAREFNFLERRSDTYSPATSTHILNILPLMFLQKLDYSNSSGQSAKHPVVLGAVDVKGRLFDG